MKTITNPTEKQIKAALALVQESAVITNDRYAMTKYGTFINNGNISTPKTAIKAIRYITVYGNTTASVAYVLENISMYPTAAITNAGYTPVTRAEIPKHFDKIETVIYEC